jgi:ATP-dependent helicase/nuclease subunit A
MRFAVQPLDDLNLGCLLVSPLLGWSQEELLDLAAGRGKHEKLWEALRARAATNEACATAHNQLVALLNMADFSSPAQFLETILSGPMQGRLKLFSRLGHSARDPVEELLSTAIAFEREESGSLERFLGWFRRGEMEVARDPALLADEVRVMTVHGAKGLEAPVVIIADAQIDPDRQGQYDDPLTIEVDGAKVPLSRSGTSALPSAFKAILDERKVIDRREHMRLLYVGLTRAIDRLVIAGLKPKKAAMPIGSWYSKVEQAMVNAGATSVEDALPWGGLLRFHAKGKARPPKKLPVAAEPVGGDTLIPDWALRAAPVEERPSRPLAPSAIAADDAAALPPSEAMRAATRRGTLIHSLLERLPPVPEQERRDIALVWLERSAGVLDPHQREEIAATVCRILSDPALSRLFAPGSMGEAPLAATLPDGRVIAGTVDRLLVEPNEVSVIDFKTGRVPADAGSIPRSHVAQMEAYSEALSVIFPGRAIRTVLLYTAGPTLFEL